MRRTLAKFGLSFEKATPLVHFPKIQHEGSGLEPPTKRSELPLFFAAIRQAERRWKALDLGSLNMQFQQDWPKDKKITALLNFCWKT